ncbi:hypothetical protein [Methanococcoides sp. LMO-2]|uniref:Uncharacterized protein n=1 Tax=Methanococcoides cohabitans TaxID=3136559 RepID=A0ABU9KSX5_9EURY
MEAIIWVAVIGAFTSIIVYLVDRRREHKLKELEFRLDIYSEFLSGISDLGSESKTHEAHLKVAQSISKMNLIASPEVLSNVNKLLDYINAARNGAPYTQAEQDKILRQIIIAIRKDIKQEESNLRDFDFRIISPGT